MKKNNRLVIVSLAVSTVSCLFSVGLFLYVLMVGAVPRPKIPQFDQVIKTKKIVIIDDNKNELIALENNPELGALIRIGSDGSQRVVLHSGKDGSGVIFTDPNKHPRMQLAHNTQGQTYLNLFNDQLKNTFQILADNKESKITLTSNKDEKKVGMGANDTMTGLLLLDEANRTRIGIYYQEDHANMMMYDQSGRKRVALSLLNNKPQFAMLDSVQRPRLSMMLHNNNPSFEFYDASGRIRFKLMEEQNDPIMAFLNKSHHPMLTMGVNKGNAMFSVSKDQGNMLWQLPD
ncbi:MAG: hypothetical protein HQM16_02970 [Deltaproteobacteria bacterium]|nr:hypothetical protein [Deltaproteobacteria bacterium]